MDKTSLGDRMKMYEANSESRVMPKLPMIVRIDGRSFSKFTKGMKKPFDDDFRQAMVETTKYLVEKTQAKIGYTQSDEISLVLHTENLKSGSTMFDGRIQKIASNFASLATVKFLTEMQKRFPEKVAGDNLPTFDARVFAVPSKMEAYNCILWRVQDATKNSVSMLAHSEFSHKSLQGLSTNQKQYKLLTERDINWNDLPSGCKQGTFVRKEKFQMKLEQDKLDKIPLDKRPEGGLVTRGRMVEIEMPHFHSVTNPIEVIFDGAQPIVEKDTKDVEMTISIQFDTDEDFFLSSNLMNEKTTFLKKEFTDKDSAISFINSLNVENLNDRHFQSATQYLQAFKSDVLNAIDKSESISFGGNWEYSVDFY